MQFCNSYFGQLVSLNNPISNEAFINDILEGLDSSFCRFIYAIEACNAQISYDELYELLLSEEVHLKLETITLDSFIDEHHCVAVDLPMVEGTLISFLCILP